MDEDSVLVQRLNRHQNHLQVLRGHLDTGGYELLFEETDETWVDTVDSWELQRATADDSPLSRGISWISDRDGWRHLYWFDPGAKSLELLTPGEFDITTVGPSTPTAAGSTSKPPSTDRSAGNWREPVYPLLPDRPVPNGAANRPFRAKVERITPKSSTGTNSYDVSPNGKLAVHRRSSFGVPPNVDLVDLPSNRVRRAFASPGALSARLEELPEAPHRFFQLELRDGTSLDGFEIRPPDFDPSRLYPVVFYVYGEPWGQTVQDSWGGSRYLWHRMLAQSGYVVISVDNRGTAAPRGRTFRKAQYKKIGLLNSADQAEAAEQILDWPYIDRDRSAVWGWSGGGSLTLNLMFRFPELYGTGVSVAPVPDQRLYDTIYQERYHGLPSDGDQYDEGSPIHFADQLEGNLLLIHGTADDNVHYQGLERLIDRLV